MKQKLEEITNYTLDEARKKGHSELFVERLRRAGTWTRLIRRHPGYAVLLAAELPIAKKRITRNRLIYLLKKTPLLTYQYLGDMLDDEMLEFVAEFLDETPVAEVELYAEGKSIGAYNNTKGY